jgi:hypothetical protein
MLLDSILEILQKLPKHLIPPALLIPLVCILWKEIHHTLNRAIVCKDKQDIVVRVSFLSFLNRLDCFWDIHPHVRVEKGLRP